MIACNYNYAGTELIIPGENKIRCSCGLEVSYQGPLYFYVYKGNEETNLKGLIEELAQKHQDWINAVSLDEELAAAVQREADLAARLNVRKNAFWEAEKEWAEAWADLVVLRKKFDNIQRANKE